MSNTTNAMEVSSFNPETNEGASIISKPLDVESEASPQSAPEDGKQEAPIDAAPDASTKKTPDDSTPQVDPPQTQAAAQNVLKDVGLDISEFEQEFAVKGELSEASYKKLADANIPKTMVDSYIKGQQALAEKFIADIHEIAGGADKYSEMCTWASQSLPEEEQKMFNHVMSSGNKELIALAVTGMTTRWKNAVGSQPKLTQGRVTSGNKRGSGFASTAEMVKAMQDKRYGADPAYTRSVEERVARSNIWG